MERLTGRNILGMAWFHKKNVSEIVRTEIGQMVLGKAAERLAAYEDTGLTPEEVEAMKEKLRGIEAWLEEMMDWEGVNRDGAFMHAAEDYRVELRELLGMEALSEEYLDQIMGREE